MTDLTALTIAEIRDGPARRRRFSAAELDRAPIVAAIEAARGAQRLYLRDAGEGAAPWPPSLGPPDRRRRGRGRSKAFRSASRISSPPKGVHTQAGSHVLDGFKPVYESTVTANLWADGAVMLGKLNMDEFAMGSSNETSYYGPVINPWRAQRFQCAARARRLVRRLGRGGGRPSLRRRHRHRHRRLDPPARRLHRHGRHQADLRPLLALGHRRLRLVARPGRPDRPRRARRRHPAAARWRASTPRTRPRSTCRCPITRRRSARASRACRSASPRNTALDGMPPEIEALWEKGKAWLTRRGGRDRRHLAAAHEIRAAGLLHRRPRRGLVEPRPL